MHRRDDGEEGIGVVHSPKQMQVKNVRALYEWTCNIGIWIENPQYMQIFC